MNRVLGTVNDEVCRSANVFHGDALSAYGFDESLAFVGRMRPSCFVKATRQNFVGGFQKDNENVETLAPKRAELLFKVGEKLPLAHVHDKRCPLDSRFLLFAGPHEARKGLKHSRRQIVDAEIPQV